MPKVQRLTASQPSRKGHAPYSAKANPENVLVQHNSAVVYNKLNAELAAKGVIFTDLHTAAREHEEARQAASDASR